MVKTIVTITPLSVEKDSRTYKQAVSVARFGYKSIVVEGQKSDISQNDLPFNLISISKAEFQKKIEDHIPSNHIQSRENIITKYIRKIRKSTFAVLFDFIYTRIFQYFLLTLYHTPRADLYYLHAFYQFPAIYILSKIYGVSYIYDAHDYYSKMQESPIPNLLQRMITKINWLTESVCIKNAVHVICVSNGIAELLMSDFGRSGIVVRNCQDTRLDIATGQSLRKSLELGDDIFLLATVGNAKPGQGIEEMIAAINKLPECVHIACVGNNYEEFLTSNNGVKKRIHLVHPVKPYEIVPFIKSADVSIILYFPSSINNYLALPNKLFQFINAGLPILYPIDLPEIKKIAEEYQIGLPINTKIPESIEKAILTLKNNRNQLSMFKKNLYKANLELNWENEEKILKGLYYQLLEGNTP